jgi:putative oxidoreductase
MKRIAWLLPLLTRFVIGFVFVYSGWGKLHNIEQVIEFFTSLGLPLPEAQAYLVSITELGCGILILAGLFTRLATIPLMVIMVVAILTAKKEDVSDLNDLFALSEFLYIVLLGWLAIGGAGWLSLDSCRCRPMRKTKK